MDQNLDFILNFEYDDVINYAITTTFYKLGHIPTEHL